MEVLHPRCAGVDVHKKQVSVGLRVAKGREVRREVRTYGTTTGELVALMDWLHGEGVTHVAMEATGPYWRPVWHVLEDAFELLLANAREVKNVPGRKSDVTDAQWLAELLAHGLMRSSFVPPEPIRELRDLTRTRKRLVEERNRQVQRIQKTLEYANIKLSSVVSDIMGVSGRKILSALIEGEDDPDRLAELGHPRLKASQAQLREALHGYVTDHHRWLLKLHVEHVNFLDRAILDLEERTAQCLEPFRAVIERLDTMPGIDLRAAAVIVAEVGVDMSCFPTDGQLISWAGLCRRLDETAGKPRSRRLRQGDRWLKTTLIQAAWAAVKNKDSYFHAKFLRIRRRQGGKKAIVAVAAAMLTAAYHMIQNQQDFHDLGADYFDRFDRAKLAQHLINRLQELGLDVEVRTKAA